MAQQVSFVKNHTHIFEVDQMEAYVFVHFLELPAVPHFHDDRVGLLVPVSGNDRKADLYSLDARVIL